MLSLYNHLHNHIGVRTIINNIREEIGLLKSEIDFLTDSVDDLQAEAEVLVGLEVSLQDIAKTQGTNVEELVGLVNENEEILSQMKSNLTQTFVTGKFYLSTLPFTFQTLILMVLLPRL